MKTPLRNRYVIGSLVIAAALMWLVTSSMKTNTLRAVPVTQLLAADATPRSFVGQRLRVMGFVGHEPVRRTPQRTPHGLVNVAQFRVAATGAADAGAKANQTLLVEYRDALPDSFRAGGPVQVDGVYSASGVMRADHVFTKCPSKYDEAGKPGAAKGAAAKGYKSPAENGAEKTAAAQPERQAQAAF